MEATDDIEESWPPPPEFLADDSRVLFTRKDGWGDERRLHVFLNMEGELSIEADEGQYQDSEVSYPQCGTVVLPREHALALAKWILAHV